MAEPTQDRGPEKPYADPQDLQFGKAAAEKEREVDEAAEEGDADRLGEDSEAVSPRPGNKAEPA